MCQLGAWQTVPMDDLKISSISTLIILIVALPILVARLLGTPLIRDLIFEASIIYLPLLALVLLTAYQKWRSRRVTASILVTAILLTSLLFAFRL